MTTPLSLLKKEYWRLREKGSTLPMEPFIEWSLLETNYRELFRIWKERGSPTQKKPRAVKIDPKRDYSLANLTWILSIDTTKGAKGKWRDERRYSKKMLQKRKRRYFKV